MLKWLAKLNFHPLTQAAEYYALSDAEQEDIPETNELQMNVAGAYAIRFMRRHPYITQRADMQSTKKMRR